jgi:glycosyltransferase involved in cell wall biosynthesis
MGEYKPKVSVITATYNHGYVIWRAIQSVLKQTYPYFELIIVDDASIDNTLKVVGEFSDPRIRYFKLDKNSGPSSARNYGLKKARGEFVAYLDSDNAWYDEFLETMMNGFDKHPDKVLAFCKKIIV